MTCPDCYDHPRYRVSVPGRADLLLCPTHAGAVAALLRYGWRLVVRVTMHAAQEASHG